MNKKTQSIVEFVIMPLCLILVFGILVYSYIIAERVPKDSMSIGYREFSKPVNLITVYEHDVSNQSAITVWLETQQGLENKYTGIKYTFYDINFNVIHQENLKGFGPQTSSMTFIDKRLQKAYAITVEVY